jgi:hypothetical protein
MLMASGMCGGDREACRLALELASQLVATDAILTRVRRRVADMGRATSELSAIDEAFSEPIGLARELAMTVHSDCD